MTTAVRFFSDGFLNKGIISKHKQTYFDKSLIFFITFHTIIFITA
jgi:hypothetical protein